MSRVTIPESRIPELVGDGFLNLILFPTEKCNFRCSYCYEDFKLGKMGRNVIDGIKNLISRRAEALDLLEISWFGGEPLLAKDVMLEISRHAQHESARYGGMKFQSNITTNGFFLSIENFQELTRHGINFFQITLDGDKELHDRTAKVECFDRIWGNLISFRNSSIEGHIELRVHYSPETWRSLDSLICKINTEFCDDSRFSVYFKSIEHYGGANDHSIGLFDMESRASMKSFLESQLARPEMIYAVPYNDCFICYAAKATSIAVRANGRLAKCTVALHEDRNDVGEIKEDGTLVLNQSKLRRWVQGLETGDKAMLQCPNSQMRKSRTIELVSLTSTDMAREWSR